MKTVERIVAGRNYYVGAHKEQCIEKGRSYVISCRNRKKGKIMVCIPTGGAFGWVNEKEFKTES